jgi:hypothetical protein
MIHPLRGLLGNFTKYTLKNMKTNENKVSEWLMKQVEKKFASDMGYKSVN